MTRREPFMDEGLMPYSEQVPPKEFDFTPFERSRKNVVNVLHVSLMAYSSQFGGYLPLKLIVTATMFESSRSPSES